MADFKAGDIIKGLPNNGYSFTNKKMQKAKVISVNDEFMKIRVLEHSEKRHIGNVFDVLASTERFEIIEKEDEKMSFTREDLKTGMFGVMNSGKRFVIVDDLIVYQEGGYDRVSSLKDDLSFDNELYISKITTEARGFNWMKFDISFIYDRDRDTVTELTIAEIKKKLGLSKLKVIEEESNNE